MANAYTSTDSASLGGTVGSAGLVQKAYDRLVEFSLRSQPLLRSVADKRPSPGTLPGSSIALQIYNDLAAQTSALTETEDRDSVAIGTPDLVTVTLNEYGNSVIATRKLQLLSLADVDPAIANIIAYNMADSIDKLVMTELGGGSNVIYSSDGVDTPTSTDTVEATDTIKAADIRKAVAKLRANNAVARKGSLYWVGIHPEVSHDLRAETGAGSWRNPHEYQSNQEIWAGEIGQFEGAYFVESARMAKANNTNSVPVYKTIIAGQQALAEAVAEEPHVVIGPVTDKLMRLRPIGWYGVLGFKRYREDALYRIESASTISA
jgi:N4-gp56 family major capsid protein